MTAIDDYPIDHLGDASDDRTIGELLLMRNEMANEIDALRAVLRAADDFITADQFRENDLAPRSLVDAVKRYNTSRLVDL